MSKQSLERVQQQVKESKKAVTYFLHSRDSMGFLKREWRKACDFTSEHLKIAYTIFLGGFQGTQYVWLDKTLMLRTYGKWSLNFVQFKSRCRANVELVVESIYSVLKNLLWVSTV